MLGKLLFYELTKKNSFILIKSVYMVLFIKNIFNILRNYFN